MTLVANSGAWVTRLTLAECAELYLIRERLEPLLLRASLPGLDDAAIGRLADLAEAMERSGSDVDAFLRADREFHLASYSARRAGRDMADHWQDVEYHTALPARVHQARRCARPDLA